MSTLKDRIRLALAASGKTQTELARACGVKPPSVNDWLSGETKSMKAVPAQRAAAFLGVNLLWLTENKGRMTSDDTGAETADYAPPASLGDDSADNIVAIDVVQNAVAGVLDAFGLRYEDLVGDMEAARARIEKALRRPSATHEDVRMRFFLDPSGGMMPKSRPTRIQSRKQFHGEIFPDRSTEQEEATERIQERRT